MSNTHPPLVWNQGNAFFEVYCWMNTQVNTHLMLRFFMKVLPLPTVFSVWACYVASWHFS